MPKRLKKLPLPDVSTKLTAELLGQYVRAKRTQLGLRIDDAAAFCGVAKETLMKLEHGHPKVQLISVLQICHGLGIKLQLPSGNEDNQDVWV